jgi:hypothetical protein
MRHTIVGIARSLALNTIITIIIIIDMTPCKV